MQLDIVTPDKNLFQGEVDYVYCPGASGSFGILKNHASIIATLKAGEVRIKVAKEDAVIFDQEIGEEVHDTAVGTELSFTIGGGVVEVLNNKVTLLAE